MEETKYDAWPSMVKITTALANQNFVVRNYKIPFFLGGLLAGLGFASALYLLIDTSEDQGLLDLIHPLAFIIIGLANLLGGKSVKWIAENSSWEERFRNHSSWNHRMIYLLVSAILLYCLYLIVFKG